MKNNFNKRIFTPVSLLRNLADVAGVLPTTPALFTSGRVSPAFRERLFLTVTSVNKCRYCTWMHTDIAQAEGVSDEQIHALLDSAPDTGLEEEKPALLYALHFAQSNRNPDPGQTAELKRIYGEEKAADIIAFLQLIFFANLSGNTFDAFLSRLEGKPADAGNAVFEGAFALLSAPVLLAIRAIYGKNDALTTPT